MIADRATISNMSPEYGATCAMWPIDARTLDYLRLTGRAPARVALVEATQALVELDVARWRPEIADVLTDLRRSGVRLPKGVPPRLLETVERASLCLEIVALAREDDGAAVSSYEIAARRAALDPLDRAARHALVAALGL